MTYENEVICMMTYENEAICIMTYEDEAICIMTYENEAICIQTYENDILVQVLHAVMGSMHGVFVYARGQMAFFPRGVHNPWTPSHGARILFCDTMIIDCRRGKQTL